MLTIVADEFLTLIPSCFIPLPQILLRLISLCELICLFHDCALFRRDFSAPTPEIEPLTE